MATFYALFSTRPRPAAVAHVCDDIACRLAGAEDLCARMEATHGPEGESWARSPCLGLCERAPAAFIAVAGESERRLSLAPATAEAVERWHLSASGRADRGRDLGAAGRRARRSAPLQPARPGRHRGPHLARRLSRGRRVRRARPGRCAIGRERVIEEVTASGLVGRGGAAFPTGRKWAAVAAAPATPRYVVCNADESEPGTFKDRILLEADPFAIVEAMTIAGFAVGAEQGYLYIRGEYPLAEARVTDAIGQARAAGLLGSASPARTWRFDIEVRRGAGAYICGEETALFASIEGRRGEPRNKPPFPVEVGLFGRPTAVNNVETLANILLIVGSDEGAARFAAIGSGTSRGPKLFCVSGHVARPGLYEVPFGTTLGRAHRASRAGWTSGRGLRAVLLGGAAGVFVGPDALETPLTFEGRPVDRRDARLGRRHGLRRARRPPRHAAPHRRVLPRRVVRAMRALPGRHGPPGRGARPAAPGARACRECGRRSGERRRGRRQLELLRDLGQVMRDASICGLGQTASSAIESAIARPGIMAP